MKNNGIVNYRKIIGLYISLFMMLLMSCAVHQTSTNLEAVSNENIEFSLLPRGKGSSVMFISVRSPQIAVNLSHSGDANVLNNLLETMVKDNTKDWAINVIMYAVFNCDALELLKSKNDLIFWRLEKKKNDIDMFRKYILEMND